MKRALNQISKVIAVAIAASAAWLIYTNMLPPTPEEKATTEDAEQATEEASAETAWVSGYSLEMQNNTIVIPKREGKQTSNKQEKPNADNRTNDSHRSQ